MSAEDPKGKHRGPVSPASFQLTTSSVGYVEFRQEDSVAQAIQLTGQKLLGIPIIAQLTEAEKNRQARNPEATNNNPNQVPFHRLYVGNIHFSITESDLQNVFEPFGELEFVQLQKEAGIQVRVTHGRRGHLESTASYQRQRRDRPTSLSVERPSRTTQP